MGLRLSLESCGYGVGVTVGAGVGIGVDAGVLIVIWPSSVAIGIGAPNVSLSRTLENVRSVVPSATAPNTTVASVPDPTGPV